jgi:hypothetical protein
MPLHRIVCRALSGLHIGAGRRPAVLRIAFGITVAVATAGAYGTAARAGDYDDPSGGSFGTQIWRAIGLPDPDHPEYEINYSERSPLVVPPSRNLPAPISADRPPSPNWPKDPDVKKRQEAAKEKIVPLGYDRVTEEGRPLRPDELVPKGGRASASAANNSGQIESKQSSFLNFDWFKKEEYGTFTGEPPRVSLTDPPPGYQTPSPDQPYGIAPEKKAYKPQTLGERMEIQR